MGQHTSPVAFARPSPSAIRSPHPRPAKPRLLAPLVGIWLVIGAWLSHEYLVLNRVLSTPSLLTTLHRRGLLFGISKLTPDPGDGLSFALGWIGFAIICLTNVYILRKRQASRGINANLSRWLDVHIFCGLLGPTLIVFHCNFQVRGLVAISFWSMIISLASGIVGRYFYVQLLREKAELYSALGRYDEGFRHLAQTLRQGLDPALLERAKWTAFLFAGGSPALVSGQAFLPEVIWGSLAGDLRLLVRDPPIPRGLPHTLRRPLKSYALARRKLHAASYFKRLMGYWHAFHLPFAVFMYVVTVIHIAAALIFRVSS